VAIRIRRRAAGHWLPVRGPGRHRRGQRPERAESSSAALPHGFSETHKNVFEPRLGLSNAINDKTIARVGAGISTPRDAERQQPSSRQPADSAQGRRHQRHRRQPRGYVRADVPLVMTMQDPVFNIRSRTISAPAWQRELTFSTVIDVTTSRVGPQPPRERNLISCCRDDPGESCINARPLRPYLGLRRDPASPRMLARRPKRIAVQCDRRYRGGLRFGMAYTLSK